MDQRHDAQFLWATLFTVQTLIAALSRLRSGAPLELEQIVNKSLAKRPEERYQHIDEMLTDLKRVRKELETPDKVHPSETTQKELKKRLFKKILIPIGILLILFPGFFLAFYIIMLVKMLTNGSNTASNSFAVASFICMIICIMARVLNFISTGFLSIFIVLTIVGALWMHKENA